MERKDLNMLASGFGSLVASWFIAGLLNQSPRVSAGGASATLIQKVSVSFAGALGQLLACNSNFRWKRVGASFAHCANRNYLLASNKAKHCRFARTRYTRPCSRR
jgi:hypothetical protein